MTSELLDLFEEAKRIIDKQEQLIKLQQSIPTQSNKVLNSSKVYY